MTGHVLRRGKNSWRLKFDAGRDPTTGKRIIQYVTVRGTKKQAQAELTKLLAARDTGTLVTPNKATLAEYLRSWILTAETLSIAPKTAERYRQLIDNQIIPHLGALPMQDVKPGHIKTWHAALLKPPAPISARTVGHAHRVLHKALADAVRHEMLFRNPASAVSPPKVVAAEMKVLDADQVRLALEAMRETTIYPQIALLLLTGMRRGELMGLQWRDIDFEAKRIRVERSVEKTKAGGLRLKEPKTSHGRRAIALSDVGIEILREHRKATLERRLALALGRLADDAFVFGSHDGSLKRPGSHYTRLEEVLGGTWLAEGHAAYPPPQSRICTHRLRHRSGRRLAPTRPCQPRRHDVCLRAPVRPRRPASGRCDGRALR